MTRQGARKKRGATDPANLVKSCEIRCSNSGLIEDSSLSACDAVSLGRWYSTLRSTAVPWVSGSSSSRTAPLDPADKGTKIRQHVVE